MMYQVFQSPYDPYFIFNQDTNLKRAETIPVTQNKTIGKDLATTWLINDSRKIRQKFFQKVAVLKKLSSEATYSRRIKLIDEYNTKLRKVHDDHRTVLIDEHKSPHDFFQPYQVKLIENEITFAGLSAMAKIFTGQSRDLFTYVEIGTGIGEVNLLDDGLIMPLARMNVQDLGWFEPTGNTIQTGTMFAENTDSGIISEAAAFNKSVGGICWWRFFIDDPDLRVENILGETVPTLSHIHTLKGK